MQWKLPIYERFQVVWTKRMLKFSTVRYPTSFFCPTANPKEYKKLCRVPKSLVRAKSAVSRLLARHRYPFETTIERFVWNLLSNLNLGLISRYKVFIFNVNKVWRSLYCRATTPHLLYGIEKRLLCARGYQNNVMKTEL